VSREEARVDIENREYDEEFVNGWKPGDRMDIRADSGGDADGTYCTVCSSLDWRLHHTELSKKKPSFHEKTWFRRMKIRLALPLDE
jgi:hypothetical protein